MNPDNFIRGGLLDNIEARIADARWKPFTYTPRDPSRPSVTAMVLELTLEYEDGGQLTKTDEQSSPKYSLGARVEDWATGEDGHVLTAGPGFNDNSNFAWYVKELVNAGFPKDKLIGNADARNFIDLVAYWKQKVQPDRPGLQGGATRTDAQGVERPRTTLMPAEVRRLPGAKPASGGVQARGATRPAPRAPTAPAAAPVATGAVQAAANGTGAADFNTQVADLVLGILTDAKRGDDAGMPMALADLKMAALRAAGSAGIGDVKTLVAVLGTPESTVQTVGAVVSATTVDRGGKTVPAIGIA